MPGPRIAQGRCRVGRPRTSPTGPSPPPTPSASSRSRACWPGPLGPGKCDDVDSGGGSFEFDEALQRFVLGGQRPHGRRPDELILISVDDHVIDVSIRSMSTLEKLTADQVRTRWEGMGEGAPGTGAEKVSG